MATKTKRAKQAEKKAKRTRRAKTSDQTKTVLDTPTLRRLCANAEKLKFQNGPNKQFWREVDPDGEHVVWFWMRHSPNLAFWGKAVNDPDFPWNFSHNGGVNIRAMVSCQMKNGKRVELRCDFDQPDWDALVK